jgi:hypothetical protein
MDVVTIALAVCALLALGFAALAAYVWSARRAVLEDLRAVQEEAAGLREQSKDFHGAFDLYRRSHLSLIAAVRPRTLSDEQKFGLKLHMQDLHGIRVRIRVAADTEPSVYAAELCNALVAAGAKAEVDPSRDVAINDKDVEGTIHLPQSGRTRLLRAALKSFAYPLADREMALARVRRKEGDAEEPEAIITVGSRRVPPELMDLPPPPKPAPVKAAAPKIRGVTSAIGAPTTPTE